jgi:threonine 3-dehydrogenase
MKAVVKAKREPGLWLEEVPVPEAGGDDVLIRVLKASICGTDVHIYNWDDWAQKTIPVPMTIGHEFAGVVDAVGEHVKGFARGRSRWWARAHHLWTLPELPGRSAASLS